VNKEEAQQKFAEVVEAYGTSLQTALVELSHECCRGAI
jgi:hypothetical protein